MTAAVRNKQLTVFRAVVYNIYGTHLFTAQIATHQCNKWMNMPKSKEQNKIYLYAAVNLKWK